jgi:hypothetical protein
LSFANTGAALSPAIVPSQELTAVMLLSTGRLNIPTRRAFGRFSGTFPSKAALNNL